MSEEIAFVSGGETAMLRLDAELPRENRSSERQILMVLGGVVGGLMVLTLGFVALVTYVDLTTPKTHPAGAPPLACPPVCLQKPS